MIDQKPVSYFISPHTHTKKNIKMCPSCLRDIVNINKICCLDLGLDAVLWNLNVSSFPSNPHSTHSCVHRSTLITTGL